MNNIQFNTQEKQTLTQKLQNYMQQELDTEIGQFDAEFLLDFISKEMGTYYYNQGVLDAQTILNSRVEDIAYAMDEIIQPTS